MERIPGIAPITNLLLIAGPCVIEDELSTLELAWQIKHICDDLGVSLVFKASYRKDNRTRLDSFTGIGDQTALQVLGRIREDLMVPVTTDIHGIADAELTAPFVDLLQIPAFLCRQSSLLEAAAQTGKWINVKKGQFMSSESMQFVAEKLVAYGCSDFLFTERGTFFGYQDLVVDFRSVRKMQQFAPVVFDCTHSNQRPNQTSGVSGGDPSMIKTLARAAVAAGADALFVETHPDPSTALSDGANMLHLDRLREFLVEMIALKKVVQSFA